MPGGSRLRFSLHLAYSNIKYHRHVHHSRYRGGSASI